MEIREERQALRQTQPATWFLTAAVVVLEIPGPMLEVGEEAREVLMALELRLVMPPQALLLPVELVMQEAGEQVERLALATEPVVLLLLEAQAETMQREAEEAAELMVMPLIHALEVLAASLAAAEVVVS